MTIKLEDAEGEWEYCAGAAWTDAVELVNGLNAGRIRIYRKVEKPKLPRYIYFGDMVMTSKGNCVALANVVMPDRKTIMCITREGRKVEVPVETIFTIHCNGKQIYPPQA